MYFALEERVIPSDSPLFQQVLTGKGVAEGEHVFLSLSKKGDTLQAPEGYRTLTCSTHVKLNGWNDARKQVLKSKIKERVRTVFPCFEEGMVHELSGAPEAWEKFVARIEVGGFPQTKENTFFNAVSHRSGVDRLWLCGDTIFPGGGTIGVSVSGYHVFRSITNYQYSL